MKTLPVVAKNCSPQNAFKVKRGDLTVWTALLIGCVLWCPGETVLAQTYPSELVTAGYRDFSYDGGNVTAEPTEYKPESKLWHHDGYWWGVLWDPVTTAFRIHQFDPNTQDWTNVGPDVDEHHRTGADALWDGDKLYVSSRMKESASRAAILNRFSYDASSGLFTLDPGFPVNITDDLRTDALTIAKDSEG